MVCQRKLGFTSLAMRLATQRRASCDVRGTTEPVTPPPLNAQVLGLAHKSDIHQIFNALRAEGDLQLIGAEAGILEDKWRK